MIEPTNALISIARQCQLLGLSRSGYYYQPVGLSEEDQVLMRLLDVQYTRTPFYGSRRMVVALAQQGYRVNRKRVVHLMQGLGLTAIYPAKRPQAAAAGHRIYPYLLRGVPITQVNQVWSTDITYIRLAQGFVYLAAVIDWFSRYVLSWRLSNTLEGRFCLEALDEALSLGRPEIFNTDQGSQFTAQEYTSRLEEAGIAVSRDGRGRALDNVFVERLWRSVKYEDIYIKDYERVPELESGLTSYFWFYDEERPHQSLDYRTPGEVHRAGLNGGLKGEKP